MHQPVRNLVIDLMLEGSQEKLEQLFEDDSYARVVYEKEKKYFLIEKYLSNELTDSENNEFKELLLKEPSLMNEMNLRKRVNYFIDKLNFIEALDRAGEEAEKEELKEFLVIKHKAVKIQLNPAIMWGVAASIVLIIGMALFWKLSLKPVPEKELFADYYRPLKKEVAQDYLFNSNVLQEGRKKYFEEDYLDVLAIFNNIPGSIDIQAEKEFFCGLALIELAYYPEAIARFERLISMHKFEYVSHAYWYLGLCYLQTGNKKMAKTTFREIVKNNSYNYKDARKILKKLE